MKMWASQEIVIYVALDVWVITLSVKIMPVSICLFLKTRGQCSVKQIQLRLSQPVLRADKSCTCWDWQPFNEAQIP